MVPEVHATAVQAYMNGRIWHTPSAGKDHKNLTPVLLTYLKSKASGSASHAGSEMAAGGQHGSERYVESLGGARIQRQRILEPVAGSRNQLENNTAYHAVPTNMDFLKCPDGRFQSEHGEQGFQS